ncbi:exosortase A [Colwelliaceae bacterium 6441]
MRITDVKFIACLGVLLLGWGWLFSDALVGMEAIWRRSDTFAHGYFILPISLWLIWRNRKPLLTSTMSTSWIALIFLMGAVLLGLVAGVADVNVVSQLASVLSLIAIIWLVIGDKLAWIYKFPLVYLLFLVPMGENLIPWLQDVTAWFTVSFLQLTGIPVFRDGLYIQTPAGLFEVAVACSGIRYLIASAAVGALFSYLNYTKLKKQLIFFAFAVSLPILANGIRAYLIVAIAHYSDMKYATGADHLVYGWLFFGFVIMLMFWIGGKFVDNEQSIDSEIDMQQGDYKLWHIAPGIVVISCAIILLKQIPIISIPDKPIDLLVGHKVKETNWGIVFQDPLARSLIKTQGYEVFAAKYANKQNKGELISFTNNLHDAERWTVIESKEVTDASGNYRYIAIRNTSGSLRSYIFQYQVGQFTSVSKMWVKLYQVIESLTGQSQYSYIYAVSHIPRELRRDDLQILLEQLKTVKQNVDFESGK